MKKIKIGFSKPNKDKLFPIYSWAIRFMQGWSNFSHVYMEMPTEEGPIIRQASGFTINEESKAQFLTHAEITDEFEFEVSDETFEWLEQYFYERLGRPYSMKEILGIFLYHVGIKTTAFNDGTIAYVCSTLIGEAAEKALGLTYDKPVCDLDPLDVMVAILKVKNQK